MRLGHLPPAPTEEKADALCVPFLTVPGMTDRPETQRWALFGKIKSSLCLCPGLRAEGNEALSTVVARRPPAEGDGAASMPIKQGGELLTHLVDSVGEREAEGV